MDRPDFHLAVVDEYKIREYLLSTSHPVGRFKASFLLTLGYAAAQWQLLSDDLIALARAGDVSPGKVSPFGVKFEVDGGLTGPSGRTAQFRTVWIVRSEERFPRFVMAFPR